MEPSHIRGLQPREQIWEHALNSRISEADTCYLFGDTTTVLHSMKKKVMLPGVFDIGKHFIDAL